MCVGECDTSPNRFDGPFEIIRADPVPFLERAIEKQHEPGKEVLRDFLCSEGEAHPGAAAQGGQCCRRDAKREHQSSDS